MGTGKLFHRPSARKQEITEKEEKETFFQAEKDIRQIDVACLEEKKVHELILLNKQTADVC